MRSGDIAGAVGRGLAAGVVGTAAMTVSSTLEAKARGRAPSTAPADAAGKVLGIQPRDPAGRARFSNAVHWGYGTGWGGMRGLLGGIGLGSTAGAAVHFASVWGSELVTLPRLGVAKPVRTWGRTEVAIDAWHHAVYVAATTATYRYLDGHRAASRGRA